MTPLYARRLIGASGLGLSLLLSACSSSGSSSGGDIATVNGVGISRATFEKRLETSPTAKQVLTQLIQGQLLDQYTDAHHITVSDPEIAKKLDELKARYPAGQFDSLIAQQGMTMDDVTKIIRQQLALQKSVDGDIKITDADIATYFAKNKDTLNQPEQIHVRHILVADLPTAQKVETELKGGAKFEDEAKKYSTDPSTKDRGGDLGFFGRHMMTAAFENAAFSQRLMVVGPPIKSPFGWHIIEVLAHKKAVPATLANSKADIRQKLIQQQEAMRVPAFLQKLQAQAKIQINDPALQSALPSPGPGNPG